MLYPALEEQGRTRIVTEVFGGYDHNLRILPGKWYDESGLTARYYPLFSQRDRRGVVTQLDEPMGICAKDRLLYIDGGTVFYDGQPVEGVHVSTEPEMLPKQIVSMGALAVIFPDKIFVNTQDLSYHGSLDAVYEAEDSVTVKLCMEDGTTYDGAVAGTEEPEEPANGQLWIDTSGTPHVLRQWSASASMWLDIATTYVRVEAAGIGREYEAGDGVSVSGLSDGEDSSLIDMLNGAHVLTAVGEDYVVFIGLIDGEHTQTGGVVVERRCPDLDFVTESGNRIWGCRYGEADGENVNEIYACKLGDPRNWRSFAGVATDSYAVSVGTDGPFTGATTYGGLPMFFKEGCVHKIYGSTPSEYTMNTTMCRGVARGAEKSLAIVNERLYYMSRSDICTYDGSLPVGISDALGDVRYTGGVAGTDENVYYISMQDTDGAWHLFAYDTAKGIWHREDNTHALAFANLHGDLLYIDADTCGLISARGRSGELEDRVEWSAASGVMGYEYPDSKYVSRYAIRARLGAGAELAIHIEYDSDGEWHEMGHYAGGDVLRTLTIPVIPRRCDHLRLRLSGAGEIKIYSITRYLEGGSDVWRS